MAQSYEKDHKQVLGGCEIVANQGYIFHLVNIECLPESDHFNIIMILEESIEELLPYLAGSLPGCSYKHGSGVINVMDDGHIVAIYPERITITDVMHRHEAGSLCESYFHLISLVKSRKHLITPVYEKQITMTILDIFRLLPRTNCGLCYSPTCMAFAAKLYRHKGRISACTPLKNDIVRYEKLLRQLEESGYRTS